MLHGIPIILKKFSDFDAAALGSLRVTPLRQKIPDSFSIFFLTVIAELKVMCYT